MRDARLVRSLQRLATALGRLERQTAAENDVSVSQLRVLTCLAAHPHGSEPGEARNAGKSGVRISDLAHEQGLAVSTMTRNIALLEKKGWVSRHTGAADRRTVMVVLTDVGRERSARLRDSTLGLFARAFDAFHPSDSVVRAVALDRVAAALEKVASITE